MSESGVKMGDQLYSVSRLYHNNSLNIRSRKSGFPLYR